MTWGQMLNRLSYPDRHPSPLTSDSKEAAKKSCRRQLGKSKYGLDSRWCFELLLIFLSAEKLNLWKRIPCLRAEE